MLVWTVKGKVKPEGTPDDGDDTCEIEDTPPTQGVGKKPTQRKNNYRANTAASNVIRHKLCLFSENFSYINQF